MDFAQRLDPSKFILGGVALSFLLSLLDSPPYNLPIYLFGAYAQEQANAIQSLQTFTGILGISTVFDIIWMVHNWQSGFVRFLTIVLLILKIPTFFILLLTMRQRGAQFGGLGVGEGTTVWSMPGGFTSSNRDGYQSVDDESYNHQTRNVPKPAAANAPAAPGAYQTV